MRFFALMAAACMPILESESFVSKGLGILPNCNAIHTTLGNRKQLPESSSPFGLIIDIREAMNGLIDPSDIADSRAEPVPQ
jgi:hypothetical protein